MSKFSESHGKYKYQDLFIKRLNAVGGELRSIQVTLKTSVSGGACGKKQSKEGPEEKACGSRIAML